MATPASAVGSAGESASAAGAASSARNWLRLERRRPCVSAFVLVAAAFGAFLSFLGSLRLSFGDGGTELADDDVDGSHRVVVAGNRDVREVGVTVGVDEADGRDAEVLASKRAFFSRFTSTTTIAPGGCSWFGCR